MRLRGSLRPPFGFPQFLASSFLEQQLKYFRILQNSLESRIPEVNKNNVDYPKVDTQYLRGTAICVEFWLSKSFSGGGGVVHGQWSQRRSSFPRLYNARKSSKHTRIPEGPAAAIKQNKSRSKFSISIEIFNLARNFQSRRLDFPQKKIGPRWVARSKMSFSLEIYNLARNLEFFGSLGPPGSFRFRKYAIFAGPSGCLFYFGPPRQLRIGCF